jgi:hypothetical protein
MPTNRTRRRRPSTAQPWMTEYLLYGYYTLPGGQRSVRKGLGLLFGEPMPPPWEDVRADLLPDWIRQHPGTRPFAWWRDEAPEPRREGESEVEYLRRHGLLTPAETRTLKEK